MPPPSGHSIITYSETASQISRSCRSEPCSLRKELNQRLHRSSPWVLQIDNTEDDAFHMLGSAIVDAVADDEDHSASLFEVWTELEEQRKLS